MVALSRRRFLGAAGALAGALMAGCGRTAARERPPGDAEVVAGLLRRERAAAAATAGVHGAAAIARQDRLHLERLAALAGVAAEADAPAGGDLETALARKQEAFFGYVRALPQIASPDARVLIMQVAASEAAHLAALRLEGERQPVPDAFAGYTLEPMR